MTTVQEHFDSFFGVDSVLQKTKRERDKEAGRHLCKLGVPHNARWNDDVTEGYREQYAAEQQEDAKCQLMPQND